MWCEIQEKSVSYLSVQETERGGWIGHDTGEDAFQIQDYKTMRDAGLPLPRFSPMCLIVRSVEPRHMDFSFKLFTHL